MQTETATLDLLDQCVRGTDPVAWERFVERFGSAIEAGVRRALRRASGARDLTRRAAASGKAGARPTAELHSDMVQECYCRLLEGGRRRLVGFRGLTDAEARAWLSRMAERCARDRLRAERAGKRGGRRTPLPLRDASLLADPIASPERRAIGRQEMRRFARTCHRLSRSERDARILHLVFFGGYTSGEVSRALGGELSPSSVDTVVHRFRRRLARDGVEVCKRPPEVESAR